MFPTLTAADRRQKLAFLSGLVGDSIDNVVRDADLARNLQVDRRDIVRAREIRGITADPEARTRRAVRAPSARCYQTRGTHLVRAQTPVLIHDQERTVRPQVLGRSHALKRSWTEIVLLRGCVPGIGGAKRRMENPPQEPLPQRRVIVPGTSGLRRDAEYPLDAEERSNQKRIVTPGTSGLRRDPDYSRRAGGTRRPAKVLKK